MHVKLYEDIAHHGHIATTYAYPVKVNGRYVMDPSPTPKFDNPKMDDCAALQLFGAGREKRIYAIPPYTTVVSLDFEDHPFERYRHEAPCALCGADDSYPRRGDHRRPRRAHVRLLRHRLLRDAARRRSSRRAAGGAGMSVNDQPLLVAEGLGKSYGRHARLPRRLVQSLRGRGAGDRRRVRLGQVDAAAAALDADASRAPGACSIACATASRATSRRSARRSGASCSAPTGATCIRTRRWACA